MPEGLARETVVVVTEPFEGAAVPRWAALISQAAAVCPRRLVVDLRGSAVVDAAAIAVLLRTHRDMVRAGGRLTLRSPVARVRRILHLARVDQVFDTEAGDTAGAVSA